MPLELTPDHIDYVHPTGPYLTDWTVTAGAGGLIVAGIDEDTAARIVVSRVVRLQPGPVGPFAIAADGRVYILAPFGPDLALDGSGTRVANTG